MIKNTTKKVVTKHITQPSKTLNVKVKNQTTKAMPKKKEHKLTTVSNSTGLNHELDFVTQIASLVHLIEAITNKENNNAIYYEILEVVNKYLLKREPVSVTRDRPKKK